MPGQLSAHPGGRGVAIGQACDRSKALASGQVSVTARRDCLYPAELGSGGSSAWGFARTSYSAVVRLQQELSRNSYWPVSPVAKPWASL